MLPVTTMTRTARTDCQACSRISRFISVFYGELDTGGDIEYVNAGHPPPLIFGRDGIRELSTGGTVIGPLPQARFRHGSSRLDPGDLLVMYTDGLVERRDRPVDDGITIAMSRLHAIADDATGVDIIEALIGELINDHVAEDDIALLVMHHTGRLPGDAST